MNRTVIRGGHVLPMGGPVREIPAGAVVIEDGRIGWVGPEADLPPVDGAEVVDAAGCAILPGLVNCHTHLCMIFGRTVAPERRLLEWLGRLMPMMARLDAEGTRTAALLGCVENVRNGNTTVVENTFIPRTSHGPEDEIFAAMRTVGVRGIVARAFHARRFPPDLLETPDEQERAVEALAARWHGAGDGLYRLSIGPLLPWIVDIDDLRATRRLADRLGLGIHMHVAESPEFNDRIAAAFGRRIRNVHLLREGDCLGPDVQAIACADLDESEIDLLARTRTAVVFDPQTRLYWGTGFPSIRPFLDAGIVAGLGTNGPAANCGQDLFETMKYACATAKTAANDPTALGRHRVLEMATIEGARALGIADRTGSLEPGKDADVIVVDLRKPHLTPAIDVPVALVYAAKGSDVRDAFVRGRVVMRDRHLPGLDEAALLAAADRAAARAFAEPKVAADVA